VADMAAPWFADRDLVTFHDPLAAATVFDPGLCGFAPGQVTVDRADGATGWRAGDGPHEVAVDVTPAAVLDHYFAVTG